MHNMKGKINIPVPVPGGSGYFEAVVAFILMNSLIGERDEEVIEEDRLRLTLSI